MCQVLLSRDFAVGDDQIWDEVASPSAVDVHQEMPQLVFLDNEKKIVDWPMILANLNTIITPNPYSDNMMKNCLLPMVNHYETIQLGYLKEKHSRL